MEKSSTNICCVVFVWNLLLAVTEMNKHEVFWEKNLNVVYAIFSQVKFILFRIGKFYRFLANINFWHQIFRMACLFSKFYALLFLSTFEDGLYCVFVKPDLVNLLSIILEFWHLVKSMNRLHLEDGLCRSHRNENTFLIFLKPHKSRNFHLYAYSKSTCTVKIRTIRIP